MSIPPPIEVTLSRIAHDLRGPLMPLRTAAWLLSNEPGDSDRISELADIVDRQSVRLARMMDELSDWGRSSGNDMRLKREPTDAAIAVDMAIGGVPGCHVEPHFTAGAADCVLYADQHWLSKLLGTLIEHASVRDPAHEPEILVTAIAGRIQIRIRDHGETLDDSRRGSLLSKPQPNPFDEGLGLRLLLARSIAEAHGGTLQLDDAIEDGLGLICEFPAHDAVDHGERSSQVPQRRDLPSSP